MTCQELEDRLQDWLDGDLAPDDAAPLRAHADACPACRALFADFCALRTALAELPTPELSVEQQRRLLARARSRRPAWPAAVAAAAAIAALALLALPPAGPERARPEAVAAHVPEVELALHRPRTVSLAVESEHTLENVTVVLELPSGVRLRDRPDQRVLRWQTLLRAGANRLSLPLVAHEPGVQELVARIEHAGRSHEVRLRLRTPAPDPALPERDAHRPLSPSGRRTA